jgi:hypothetical protein
MMACHALGIFASQKGSYHQLEQALPNIDSSALQRIAALRDRPEETISPDELREVFNKTLIYTEELNDAIVVILQARQEI